MICLNVFQFVCMLLGISGLTVFVYIAIIVFTDKESR